MAELTPAPFHQELATDISSLLHARILTAEPVHLLSWRNDKVLEVVQERNGQYFVRRSCGPYYVDAVESLARTTIDEAWEGLRDILSNAGIAMVPSFTIKAQDSEYPFVIVSEYLDPPARVAWAPLETKVGFARSLGAVLLGPTDYLPMNDWGDSTFHLRRGEDGQRKIVLTDVDPYLVPRKKLERSPDRRDDYYAHFIESMAKQFWNRWCSAKEREPVLKEFLRSVSPVLEMDGMEEGSKTLTAISKLHMLSLGVDLENRTFS